MGEKTEIEWADSTFNPWTGCTKVSPGCANCYAERMCGRFGHLGEWGPGAERKRTGVATWRKPIGWNEKAGRDSVAWATNDPLKRSSPRPRVFCGSLCDWLDPEVPAEWLADLMALIGSTPHLDWLMLTKRPELWRSRLVEAGKVSSMSMELAEGIALTSDWLRGAPPSNVWIGTTVEDQQRADERIPVLLRIPARLRFLSCEPLLGHVDLVELSGIGWVIAGGESGPRARPMHSDWARSLRDQCKAADVPFMFKQWGEWGPLVDTAGMHHVGKKKAGRLLDGVLHDEFPRRSQ